MLQIQDILELGKPKTAPTAVSYRLGHEWNELRIKLATVTGLGHTRLYKEGMQLRALLESVDSTGMPVEMVLRADGQEIDLRTIFAHSHTEEDD